MAFGKPARIGLLPVLILSACSSDSSDVKELRSALQDLGLDAAGLTTVVSFGGKLPATLGPGNFEANGGQLATQVMVSGSQATVVWDERVTPSHRIRAVGFDSSKEYVPVTTSDASAPTFAIASADQNPGLGGDMIGIQFSGPRVVEATAEDPANWALTVNGTALDLTGSTFDLDPLTQTLVVTTGPLANLHASFDLAPTASVTSVADVPLGAAAVPGAATGDSSPPVLISAEQNLPEDEFGRVVDFTFSEAMDPVFSVNLFSFDAGFPVFATQVDQPAGEVLRVTFTEPVIPGVDSVNLTSLLDAHGNAFADTGTPVAAGSTVANGFDLGPDVTTVENSGGDTVVATLVQALDPETAEEPGRWILQSPTGTSIDLSNAALSWDFQAKTLTVVLSADDLLTGDSFTFGSAGPGSGALDVDGQEFLASASGTVAGDAAAPSVSGIVQNRQLDPLGLTYEVSLSEDVAAAQAQIPANYVFSNGASAQSATLLGGQDLVRLTVDMLVLPGTDTVDVQGLVDLAGNAMGLEAGLPTTSTDATAPSPSLASATAVEGADDDTVRVVFDDYMVPAGVTDLGNWVVQSPIGTVLSPLLGSVSYNDATRAAVLTLTGTNLQTGDDFAVRLMDAQDLGGNVVDSTSLTGPVDAEARFPEVASVWVEDAPNNTNVHLRFDEPGTNFDPADGLTRYVLRDPNGFEVGGGVPTVTPDADGLGATLSFALAVVAGSHTLDVRGVTDLAGNQLFAVEAAPIDAEDDAEPALALGLQTYLAVPGERNDTLSIVFDRQVSSWGLLDAANYAMTDGVSPVDFATAELSFDGDRTVLVELVNGYNLDNGAYTLTVQGVTSVQGIAMTAPSMDTATADPSSDSSGPNLVASRTRLDAQDPADAVLIEFDEAIDSAEAVTATNYTIAGQGDADSVVPLGARTVRATWNAGVTVGQMVDVTMTDLASNSPGLQTQAIQAEDTAGPAVSAVSGTMVPGAGGDRITVTYNQPVGGSALVPGNYSFAVLGTPLDVTAAGFAYDSGSNQVELTLPDTFDFQVGDSLNAVVSGIISLAGITMSPPANVNGPVSGDATGPVLLAAFVNQRESALGRVVDVLLSEDVDQATATNPGSYELLDSMGMPIPTTVTSVEALRGDALRLTLSAALGAGEQVLLVVTDVAGNLGASSVTPAH